MRIIAGTHRNRKLVAPKGLDVRPTASALREALFNVCQAFIEDASFLDLFAGSGAMALEALSRGAKNATLIDSSRDSLKCIHRNIESLQLQDQTQVLSGDVFKICLALDNQKKQFDIIFADPPYNALINNTPYPQHLLDIIDNTSLLANSGLLLIEHPKKQPLNSENLSSLLLTKTRHFGRSSLSQYKLLTAK